MTIFKKNRTQVIFSSCHCEITWFCLTGVFCCCTFSVLCDNVFSYLLFNLFLVFERNSWRLVSDICGYVVQGLTNHCTVFSTGTVYNQISGFLSGRKCVQLKVQIWGGFPLLGKIALTKQMLKWLTQPSRQDIWK